MAVFFLFLCRHGTASFQYQNVRYFILDNNSSAKNFADARLACGNEGGILPKADHVWANRKTIHSLITPLIPPDILGYSWLVDCSEKRCKVLTWKGVNGLYRYRTEEDDNTINFRNNGYNLQICRCKIR